MADNWVDYFRKVAACAVFFNPSDANDHDSSALLSFRSVEDAVETVALLLLHTYSSLCIRMQRIVHPLSHAYHHSG